MLDADSVANLIVAGEAYLADVRRYRDEAGRDRFLADRGEQYRIAFPLQQAIQIGLDLAAHLVADMPGHRPETLADLFQRLAERRLIEQSLATRLAAMARFLNLLVHQYADVNAARVWEILTNDLQDLEEFFGLVAQMVKDA